jgi:hypothetical protein
LILRKKLLKISLPEKVDVSYKQYRLKEEGDRLEVTIGKKVESSLMFEHCTVHASATSEEEFAKFYSHISFHDPVIVWPMRILYDVLPVDRRFEPVGSMLWGLRTNS